MNFKSDGIEEYGSLVAELERGKFCSKQNKLELDVKHSKSPPAKPSLEEAPKLDLKVLPPHLRYIFLGTDDTLPIIIASNLNVNQLEYLLEKLKRFK